MGNKEILARIGFFKNKKNLSSYELSLRLGKNKTYFYRIESGQSGMSINTFLQVLKILEISTFEFFYPNLESFEQDLKDLELLQSLKSEERQALMTILKIKR